MELLNNATFHRFLWNQTDGMQDLGALLGDCASFTLGSNDA